MVKDFPQEAFFPQKTVVRIGAALKLANEALEFGDRGLIVHGRSLEKNGYKEKILRQFPASAVIATFCRDSGEPTLDEVNRAIEQAKAIDAEWVAGIGGGSVLDLAKAAAGLFRAAEKPIFYQEGGRLDKRGIPFIAVPTTAGSGSEATINSVIINKEKKIKRSIRDERFLARTIILDAALLEGLPPSLLGDAAMDAFVQAYESFISRHATWLSENFALKAIELINRNIEPAYESGAQESLSSLLLGSYCAGIALASSRLGVIHGIAHPLGVLYNQAHGRICSVCFLPSLHLHRQIIEEKYGRMSRVLGMDLSERIEMLLVKLDITSPFRNQPLREKEDIIRETLHSGSTAAGPKEITRADVEFMLKEIF